MTSQNNSTAVCIEKVLCSDEPFLVHESNITSNQKMIESLRNESKQLLIDQQAQVRHCVVMTQAELTADLSLVPSEKNQHNEQCVHILLTLDALQLLPRASHNFFGARFIDKDSAIVVYVRLDLGVPSEYLNKKIDDNSVHVQVFQPSRLNDDPPFDHKNQKNEKLEEQADEKSIKVDESDSKSLLRVAIQMNQDRNDFGLSMLLQIAIRAFFKQYPHFCTMFDEIRNVPTRGVLSSIVQLVRSEIQMSSSKCLVSGRTVTSGYRPGFINVLKCLDHARESGFGYSLLRHYLKYEEPLLRYILSSAKAYKEGCFAPFPCLFYDEQLPRAGRKLPDLNDELSDTPHINHLKRWLENRSLRADNLDLLSDTKVNQVLWLVLSNRIYLSPAIVPNSEDAFGSEAKLYAFLSVDKSSEDVYEQVKAQRNMKNPDVHLDKISHFHPQFHDDLFPRLTSARRNSTQYFGGVGVKALNGSEAPEYALVVKYIGRVTDQMAEWELDSGEFVIQEAIVPRLLIWYSPNHYKKLEKPIHEFPGIVSWCSQFRDTQY